jgi:hypothetical protein
MTRRRWFAAILALSVLGVALGAVLIGDHQRHREREAWLHAANATGCLVHDNYRNEKARSAVADFLGLQGSPQFRIFIPSDVEAARLWPLIRGRSDVAQIDIHCEDVSMEMKQQLASACQVVPWIQRYNPTAAMSPRLGRHLPTKDWNGDEIAGANPPGGFR